MKKCFVICPIGDEKSDIRRRSDQLSKYVIEPVCEKAQFRVNRVDQMSDNNSITDTIIKELTSSDLVIADLSDHNPNAFFELGFRTATNRPVIQVKNIDTVIPFDVSAIRTITYNLTDPDDLESAKSKLLQTIQSIDFTNIPTSSSSVTSQNNQIMQTLFNIKDAIDKLSQNVNSNQNETITTLIKALSPNVAQKAPDLEATTQAEMIKAIFSNPKLSNYIAEAAIQNMNLPSK